MSDKILGICKSITSHGLGIHEEVTANLYFPQFNSFPCSEFKRIPSDIIWACTESFRDIIKECFKIHGETGSWVNVIEMVKREKSKLEDRTYKLELAKDTLTEYMAKVHRLETEVEILKKTLQEEILNNS